MELQTPPEVYERARQVLKASNRSVESVLLDGLTLFLWRCPIREFPPMNSKTTPMSSYVRLCINDWPQCIRLRELIALGKQGQITDEEKAEMERLIDLVDHQMLLRSEALLLLKQCGHDVIILKTKN